MLCITDFGLSNCVKVVQTKEGPKAQEYCVTQCGSPAYAAPELLGRRKYGPQVDIWSMYVHVGVQYLGTFGCNQALARNDKFIAFSF